MKTPEEIFNHHASRIMKQFDMDNFKRDFPTLWKTIEETLKAMQSEHDAEMIEFDKWLGSKVNTGHGYTFVDGDWYFEDDDEGDHRMSTMEVLTQFRKG